MGLRTPPLRRRQRAGDPLARLAYLDGLGQRAVLAAESCQGPAEESPPAARARRPGRLCSGRGPLPCKGPGQPPPPPAGPACCQGKESKEPWRRSARRALPDPLSAVPPLLSARERRRLGTRVPGGSALSCRRAMGTDVPCGKGSSSPSAARVPACARRREGPSCPCLLQTHQPCGQVHLGCQRGRVVAAALRQPARNTPRSPSSPAAERAPGELHRPLAVCERWGRLRWHPERPSPLPGSRPASPGCWRVVSLPGQGEKSGR